MEYLQRETIRAWVTAQRRWGEIRESDDGDRGASVPELIIIGVGLVAVALFVVSRFRDAASDGIDCLDLTGTIPEGCAAGTTST